MTFRQPERFARVGEGAFTLIEVLLAVSVFAIVLAAINSVFFGALRLRNKAVQSFERALPLQQALAFIQKDLEGIMLPGGRLAGTFTTTIQSSNNNNVFIGERVTPDIYTASGNVGVLARWADVQKVVYFLAAPTNRNVAANGRDLVRQVTRNLLPATVEEQESHYLLSGVETIRLQYYDGLTWADTWDSSTSTNLPTGIKVQIVLGEDRIGSSREPAPIELVIPVMVQSSSTNSTGETGGSQ
jgi:type II secretion system protein J